MSADGVDHRAVEVEDDRLEGRSSPRLFGAAGCRVRPGRTRPPDAAAVPRAAGRQHGRHGLAQLPAFEQLEGPRVDQVEVQRP